MQRAFLSSDADQKSLTSDDGFSFNVNIIKVMKCLINFVFIFPRHTQKHFCTKQPFIQNITRFHGI